MLSLTYGQRMVTSAFNNFDINTSGKFITKLYGEKWKALIDEHKKPFDYDGEIKAIKGYEEPNPNSSEQIKSWLYSLGWIPETFKYVKDDDGSERKIPQIYVQGSGG